MFGKTERKVLWTAFKQPFGAWVFLDPAEFQHREGLCRATKALQALGLLDRANIENPYHYPRRAKMHVRLTSIGRQFCDTYSAPLQTGSRLSLRVFERKTGITFPTRRRTMPQWLIKHQRPARNPHPASNPSPALTVNQTAA